jgi:hypothetical protein
MSDAPVFIDNETITLTRNGVWLSNGHEITHREQCRAFARNLGRDSEGWFIRIRNNLKRIEVEDTAYFVESVEGSADAGFLLLLSDGSEERLLPDTLRYSPDRLTCLIHKGRDEAKLLSAPYSQVLGDLRDDSRSFFVVLEGKRIELAAKSQAL